MRVAFVHTVGFLVENFRERMRTQLPDVDCFHSLNESLLQDLLRGAPQAEVYRRVVEQIMLVADADADAAPDLIVVTCSSTSPAVDIARGLVSQPVLKIDDAMASLAVSSGPRVGLLCTATSTVEPSSALLRAHAKQQGAEISIEVLLQAEAYKALMAGDRAAHDEIIEAAAKAMLGKVDVLVLAQASLAHLQERIAASLPIPVLASPQLLMDDIARRVAGFNSGPRA
ncbi:MAG: Asp/Glu/hydantoin racemase [Pseudomonas sp.]|nr:Asp/Glu/hydantoin racemase [Pseudomonas sp.]